MMSATDQRIVITGGSGFIGTALREKLVVLGYSSVISPNARLSDRSAFAKILQKDDIIIHLACSNVPGIAEKNREEYIEKDIAGSVMLFEVCVEKGVKKVIYLSSGGTVYGETLGDASKETDPTNPKNSHGALKLAIEKYLGVFGNLYGLSHTILRLSNPYGKRGTGGNHRSVVDIFFAKALADEPLLINGDGAIVRDYIYIDDAVNFILQAVTDDRIAGVYNLGSGVGTSLNTVVTTIETVLGRTMQVTYMPKKSFDISRVVLDIDKARKSGWKPKHTLEDGIRAIVARAPL